MDHHLCHGMLASRLRPALFLVSADSMTSIFFPMILYMFKYLLKCPEKFNLETLLVNFVSVSSNYMTLVVGLTWFYCSVQRTVHGFSRAPG